eukprot:SAG11_NODE_707_length_7651_cov_4.133872_3_plen_164_part_00
MQAVNTLVFVPCTADLLFHLCYRATVRAHLLKHARGASTCEWDMVASRGRAHPSQTFHCLRKVAVALAKTRGSLGSRGLPRAFSDEQPHDAAVEEAYLGDTVDGAGARLVAVVVVPSALAFGVTLGAPLWLLLLAYSPMNALFAYLFEVRLCHIRLAYAITTG